MTEPRKLYVKSFGCQMNVYNSRRMADTMAPEGYVETTVAEDADLVILNTCHIREKAAEKVYSELGRVRVMKDAAAAAGRNVVVAVAGCVAQAEGEEIIRRAPAVDLVFGPQSYHRLPELLARAARDGKAVDTEFSADDKFDQLAQPSTAAIRARGVSAFVTVQEGCDKFCTFCVVPYTRGAEVSRPAPKILAEIERLAAAGVREITLIGQNVNAYHGDGPDGRTWTLPRLLARAAQIDGVGRLRYTTSHPRDMNDDLIAVHRNLPELMPQLHLPVQSGSDRILAAMNRRHTRADYLDIVRRLRQARPDLALTSDFIVGFPGETESDFAETLSLLDEVGFSGAFSFSYSQRPGTPGAEMDDQVPEEVKSERLQRLQDVIDRQQETFNRSCIGSASMCCSKSRAGIKARSSAARPICSRCRWPLRSRSSARSPPSSSPKLSATACWARWCKGPKEHPKQRRNENPLFFAQELELRTPETEESIFVAPDNTAQIILTFDDNRLASSLFGQYGQNLALIERRLGIVANSRGNQVTVEGAREACDQARRVLESLYERLKTGDELSQGDVDGTIRLALSQGSLFDFDPAVSRENFEEINLRKRRVRARTPAQDAYIRALKRHALVFSAGPAGTGKTWLAVAHAVQLFERKEVDRIVLSRPAVEAGERLGFLPGDMREKVDPYLRPIYDALYDMMDARIVERALQSTEIEIAPLAFMRGRTLSNAVVILDEAQNTTTMQMKMLLTRLGENSRMIVTGDPSQVDLLPGQTSGLADAMRLLAASKASALPTSPPPTWSAMSSWRRIVNAYEKEAARKRERRE